MTFASLLVLTSAQFATAQARPPGRSSRAAAEDNTDDRLPRATEKQIQELIGQGKPDQIAALLAKKPKMFRIYVARAYAQAGIDAADARLRERYVAQAVKEYQELLALEADATWFRGERRRFDVAQWHIELSDLILRRLIAPDMDRFEITSGLDFNRDLLAVRLKEAQAGYVAAGRLLDELAAGVRTEEDRYLLLGIASKIAPLQEQRQLNSAWVLLYLAITGDPAAEDRNDLLAAALDGFDAVGRKAKETDRKYNALLGAGIALYHGKRYNEADAAFDRIIRSTAPLPLAARARLEKARASIQTRNFAEARNQLDALSAISDSRLQGEDAGAAFYVRLAPLIRAYSYLCESQERPGQKSDEAKAARDRAYSDFAKIAEQGGVWPEIVQVYLDACGGAKRPLADLTDHELRMRSERLMAAKDYAGAIAALKLVLDRPTMQESHAEARFNLGVCLFQMQDLSAAGQAFFAVAKSRPPGEFGEKATEYAYRCWRQVAHDSAKPDDYRQLAEAGEVLAAQFPKNNLAAEAAWIAALARQEAGDFQAALAAYAKVPAGSRDYWTARRNMARCKQAMYDSLPDAASPPRRRRAAEEAAESWRALADDVAAARKAQPADAAASKSGRADLRNSADPAEADQWIAEARLFAAASFAGDDIRGYAEALRLLADLPLTGRVLALRLRCYRGLGDLKTANLVLEEFLKQSSDASHAAASDQPATSESEKADRQADPAAALAALLGLAAEMEQETARLKALDRGADAAQMAAEAVDTIRQLLDWIDKQPAYARHVPVVRYSLVKSLAQAGRPREALKQLELLMADSPDDGEYVCAAARLQEDCATVDSTASAPASGRGASRDAALDKAEALWHKLLEDQTLRDRAPEVYWEARYNWLRHQFRHGRAAEVFKGIAAERAWYPDLGGPPWRDRLLDLSNCAEAAALTEPRP